MFATKPIIDNAYVMHHTILYGCPADIDMGRWHSIFIASASFGLANIAILIQWTLDQLTKSNVWPWDYSLGGPIFQLSSLWFSIVKTLDFSKLIPNTRSIASTQIIVVVIISLGRPSNWLFIKRWVVEPMNGKIIGQMFDWLEIFHPQINPLWTIVGWIFLHMSRSVCNTKGMWNEHRRVWYYWCVDSWL